jgi:hypothetical protein
VTTAPRHGIPLRPDPGALRDAAMLSVTRACLGLARTARARGTRNEWPEDRNAELLTRAASSPTTLAGTQALAQFSWQFVESLVPVSAAAAVLARSLRLSFDGAAQINVPALTLPYAGWVGEGAPIAVDQGTSSPGAVVTPSKLAVIFTLTRETVDHSNAEMMTRMVLTENVAPTLDATMFSTTAAVPNIQPGGILAGITALTASTGPTPLDAMVADIASLAAAVAPVGGGSPPLLIASPKQTAALTLRAPRDMWPVLMSTALPAGTVIALVPGAIVSVVEAPNIEASRDVGVVHEESVPGQIVDGSGVVAHPVRSLWQTDSVSIRFTMNATWARRSPSAVAFLQNVTW